MSDAFDIVPIAPRHADVWAAMRIAQWPDASPNDLRDEVRAWFGGERVHAEAVLIAQAPDGTAIGCVELTRRAYAEGCETTPVAFVESWFVVPEWQRRGVGRALIDASGSWARANGMQELASDALESDRASHAAHGAVGFEDMGAVRCFRRVLA